VSGLYQSCHLVGVSSYHDRPTSRGPGVLVGRKGTAGAVYYVEKDYWAHDTTLWVNDFKGNSPRFIYHVLGMLDLKRFDTGSSNPTLNRNLIHPERVAFPLPNEQLQIASAIDTEVKKQDRAISAAQRQISLLREYRTRLIADVVTGKLDVREAAVRLPDEAEEAELMDDAETLTDDNEMPEGTGQDDLIEEAGGLS
jgi:type I restriction enzyme, S subunit